MSGPQIHRKRPVFSTEEIKRITGDQLSKIKQQDALTWPQMARIADKSEDQIAKYAQGHSEMPVSAYLRFQAKFGGRFSGPMDRMCHEQFEANITDRSALSCVMRGVTAIVEAIEDDDRVCAREVNEHRAELVQARDAIEMFLRRGCPATGVFQ